MKAPVLLDRVMDLVGLAMESEPRPRKPYPSDVSDNEMVVPDKRKHGLLVVSSRDLSQC